MKNQDNYMFFRNLQTIKAAVDSILQMDPNEVDQMLSAGHDWAVDHIATAKDDVEEVIGFLTTSDTTQLGNTIGYSGSDAYNNQPQFVPVTIDTKDKMTKFIKEIIRKVNHVKYKK